MAIIEPGNVTEIVSQVGQIGLWLQALGLVVVAYIVFEVISVYFQFKRLREVNEIRKDMVRIEKKIDSILKNK